MYVTIHPPKATSMPTYISRKKADTHVTRCFIASLVAPLFWESSVPFVLRNLGPVSRQKDAIDVANSTEAAPI